MKRYLSISTQTSAKRQVRANRLTQTAFRIIILSWHYSLHVAGGNWNFEQLNTTNDDWMNSKINKIKFEDSEMERGLSISVKRKGETFWITTACYLAHGKMMYTQLHWGQDGSSCSTVTGTLIFQKPLLNIFTSGRFRFIVVLSL